MTIKEALEQRIPRIRLAKWRSEQRYLRLPLFKDRGWGPWAELYDDIIQERMPDLGLPQRQLFLGPIMDEDSFEVYRGPVSKHEHEHLATIYAES